MIISLNKIMYYLEIVTMGSYKLLSNIVPFCDLWRKETCVLVKL